MIKYSKTAKYDKVFLSQNMMGPNSMLILEELLGDGLLEKGMRVLDLGCGNALTSVFLAKEYGVQVFAVDLWVSATDNLKRLEEMKVDELVVPIHADANELPFAENYFDAVISVDAYHYFGNNDGYFEKLRRLLKQDGLVALAFPGMKQEFEGGIPAEMEEHWEAEALEMWHTMEWWRPKFDKFLKGLQIKEMECFEQAWSEWLCSENPYAVEDRAMMAKDNGRFMNIISVTGKVN